MFFFSLLTNQGLPSHTNPGITSISFQPWYCFSFFPTMVLLLFLSNHGITSLFLTNHGIALQLLFLKSPLPECSLYFFFDFFLLTTQAMTAISLFICRVYGLFFLTVLFMACSSLLSNHIKSSLYYVSPALLWFLSSNLQCLLNSYVALAPHQTYSISSLSSLETQYYITSISPAMLLFSPTMLIFPHQLCYGFFPFGRAMAVSFLMP